MKSEYLAICGFLLIGFLFLGLLAYYNATYITIKILSVSNSTNMSLHGGFSDPYITIPNGTIGINRSLALGVKQDSTFLIYYVSNKTVAVKFTSDSWNSYQSGFINQKFHTRIPLIMKNNTQYELKYTYKNQTLMDVTFLYIAKKTFQ